MANPLLPDAPVTEPVAPNPNDRYSTFTKLWVCWVAAFAIVEAAAVYQDKRSPDRVKRTLSSNLRTWFATDSITGVPVNVPYGKLRRIAFVCASAWLIEHLKQQGRV